MSTLMFLEIDDGSMSMWMISALGAKRVDPAGDPVVEARADRRPARRMVHGHVRVVVPCIPSMSSESGIRHRERAQAHEVWVTGIWVSSASSSSSGAASEEMAAAAHVQHRALGPHERRAPPS
jgi:hypothetical protein